MRRWLALSVGAVLFASPLISGVADAVTPPDSSMSIFSGDSQVTTTTGQKLYLGVNAQQDITGGIESSWVRVHVATAPVSTGWLGEMHSFNFPVPNADISFAADTGKLTIDTHTDIAPYGALHMTFTPSSSTTSCQTQDTAEVGTLAGALHFKTRTRGWGAMGRNDFSFGANTTHLSRHVDLGYGSCGTNPVYPGCYAGIVWYGPGSTDLSLSGRSDTSGTRMSLFRGVALGQPAGASRGDSLAASVRAPRVESSSLRVRSGGPFSGSAQIADATRAVSSGQCWQNGTGTFTEQTTSWTGGDWTSPSAQPLSAHFQVTRDWQSPASVPSSSSYFEGTYS